MFKTKMVPFSQIDKTSQKLRIGVLASEFALSLAGVGLLIACIIMGDENGRFWSIMGLICVGLAPISLEILRGKRFTFSLHLIYVIHLTLTTLCGCVLMMHEWVLPFDEIMHTVFGYVSCIYLIYVVYAFLDYKKIKPIIMGLILLMVSMGIASMWEVLEFTMDLFLGQNSLGINNEALEALKAQGFTGVKLAIEKLKHISALDTVTDMLLHLLGSALFVIQFLIHKYAKKNLLIGTLTKEIDENRMNKVAQ